MKKLMFNILKKSYHFVIKAVFVFFLSVSEAQLTLLKIANVVVVAYLFLKLEALHSTCIALA